jgi:hypothetical protein
MSAKRTALAIVLFLAAGIPAVAQVQRVVVEAEGISRACSPGLEAVLKSLDSVYKYAISVDKQMFSVTYYSGEKFQPKDLRLAADKGEAYIRKIHVSAAGKVQDEGDKQIFIAGDDRFVIVNPSKLPVDVKIGIMGVVKDDVEPMQIAPDDFKVLTDESPSQEANPKPESNRKTESNSTEENSSEK